MKKFELDKDAWSVAFAGVLLGSQRQGRGITRYRAMKEANQLLVGVAPPPKPGACYPRMAEFERLNLVSMIDCGQSEGIAPAPGLRRWYKDAVGSLSVGSAQLMLKDWQVGLKSIILLGDAEMLAGVLSGLEVVAYSMKAPSAHGRQQMGANDALLLATISERQRFAEYMESLLGDYRKIAKKLA